MGGSPLGPYAARVAAIVSIGVVAAYILAIVFQRWAGITDTSLADLKALAFLAAGTIFGSSIGINGVKAQLKPEIDAAHSRLDLIHAPPADGSS
jgi:hypothetical protein